MRCLGIDHGTRRIGLSYGDDIGVATPLPALSFPDGARQWAGIAAVLRDRKITDIVLGHPLNMDGTSGPKALEVEEFARRLASEFNLPVHLVDERLTSYEAESTIPPAKRRAARKTGLVDSRAATLVLQDFLDGHMPGAAGEGG
ncbi:MAG TPA: Holliday junction resolvase RuvX [Opitutaceae bacterium]|nr:Holliday junction resolvase RuvX [Opitutaceae bacterium]